VKLRNRFRRAFARCALLVWLALTFAACEPEGADTSILITVDSDLKVPSEIDRITVNAAGMQEGVDEPSADLREKGLPRSIVLTHAGGPYGPFEVVVSAYLENTLVAQKTLRTSFLPGIHSRLSVNLARGCANVFCGDALTCSAGACVPVSETLPSARPEDSGAGDAAPFRAGDAGALDADAARDGGLSPDAGAAFDGGVKLDGGTKSDAGAGVDAGAKDAGMLSDARADGAANEAGTDAGKDGGALPAGAGATPVCLIARPLGGATLLTNVTFSLLGSCMDAESGALGNVFWASSVEGPLATGAATSAVLRTSGAHDLLLCAPDPRDAKVVGCATVRVNATPQPTARILSVRQGSDDSEPFATGSTITIQGTATGTGATMSWRDSLQGSLGSGSTVTLSAPVAGRHVITLDVRDQYGLTASATQAFLVAPGR
jgi:hypothetical protein